MKSIEIQLNPGPGKIEIEYSDALIDQIRRAYNMQPDDEVSPELISMFLQAEIRSAIKNFESQNSVLDVQTFVSC